MDTDTAWLAGIIEGEGCIDLRSTGALRIRVKMTDEDVIRRIADLWGCSVRAVPRGRPHHKDQFEVNISGRRAEVWAERMRPLLGARRQAHLDACMADSAYRPGRALRALS